jgi:hypothetical protein
MLTVPKNEREWARTYRRRSSGKRRSSADC